MLVKSLRAAIMLPIAIVSATTPAHGETISTVPHTIREIDKEVFTSTPGKIGKVCQEVIRRTTEVARLPPRYFDMRKRPIGNSG
jgi:hypothetical protein